jgi:hypothetical protein
VNFVQIFEYRLAMRILDLLHLDFKSALFSSAAVVLDMRANKFEGQKFFRGSSARQKLCCF